MTGAGLVGVPDPSALFGRSEPGEVGAAVTCVLEGTRPLLLEIQSLVAPTDLAMPRRVGTGVDPKRLAMIVAVLARHAGLPLGGADVFVNVAGGVRIDEPGADLGIALAIASAARGVPVREGLAAFGEIGLTGRLRAATQASRRLEECRKLGLSAVLAPAGTEGAASRPTRCRRRSRLGARPRTRSEQGFSQNPCKMALFQRISGKLYRLRRQSSGPPALSRHGRGSQLVQGRRQSGVPAPRCGHHREARAARGPGRDARIPDDQDPPQRHDGERAGGQRRAGRVAEGDRRGGRQEGRQVPDERRHGDAEELEPALQAQPRQDEDRRHLRDSPRSSGTSRCATARRASRPARSRCT